MADQKTHLKNPGLRPWIAALVLAVSGLVGHAAAFAQPFDSGSDGSDGALELTTPGTIDFLDPTVFDPPLDPDGDGVYHFTTVTVGAGVTLTLRSASKGPVVWLASGEVRIDGVLDASGIRGHHGGEAPVEPLPGTGGYTGGPGRHSVLPAQDGNGPGGGDGSPLDFGWGGAGAGHAAEGEDTQNNNRGGRAYGNVFILPLVGGSGGGGGDEISPGIPGGGGSGGGALLIASSEAIRLDGTIRADGGAGGEDIGGFFLGGGGGSGGALRLVAPVISGAGTLSADGGARGTNGGGAGSPGRIRLEAFHQSFTGDITPAANSSVPSPLTLPAAQMPVRVVRVGGVDVPATPTGSFVMPDVTIDTASPVTLDIEASGIPLGTVVQVTLASEDGSRTTVDSTPLAGTLELSTATATTVIPHGLTRFFVEATWTP